MTTTPYKIVGPYADIDGLKWRWTSEHGLEVFSEENRWRTPPSWYLSGHQPTEVRQLVIEILRQSLPQQENLR